MIVDDTMSNVIAIKNIFLTMQHKFKMRIIMKKDGGEAVDAFKTANVTESKDNINLVIMDQNMGKMHGDEATRIVLYI